VITIGSDPEFGLLNQDGRQAMARNYLSGDTTTEIGCDGHSDIGELRPLYSDTPRGHLYNVAALVERVGDIVPGNIRITAGSMVADDGIGGHIHFGGCGDKFSLSKALHALDYYLSLPVAMIEVQASARYRRTRTGYGKLASVDDSAWRRQGWGFEYRTLPSWLQGWGIALSVLSIGYAVVDAVEQGHCPYIPKDIPNPTDFNHCDKGTLRQLIPHIKTGWRKLPLYPAFRLEFAFLNHLLSQGVEWKEGQDIRNFWPATKDKAPGTCVRGNPRDFNCPRIAALVKAPEGKRVLIYGLNPDRKADIAINDMDMVGDLDSGYKIHDSRYGIANEYDGWLCIGLSYVLREDVHAVADLINKILMGG